MLGENARDVIIDHDNFVDFAVPLLGEHTDSRRAAADAHAFFHLPVDDRGLTGFDDHASTAIDGQLHGLAVAEVKQRLAGDPPLFLAAVGQMVDPAQRKHLRAVFTGRDVADRLAFGAHRRTFRPKVTVGIDLQLDAAIRINALGHDRDHVDAVYLGGDDKRCRLIVGISGTGANGRDDRRWCVEDVAAPFTRPTHKRHDLAAILQCPFEQDMRIDADQFAVAVGVTIASAGHARADVAKHRAGIAADFIVGLSHERHYPAVPGSPRASDPASRGCAKSGRRWRDGWR